MLYLSRNIFFYKELELDDTYETRIFLMFFHYSLILYIFRIKNKSPDQDNYNSLFINIENNLREMGFGDVSVNKKMKDLNKIFYDILLKLNNNTENFALNKNLVLKYFDKIKNNDEKWLKINDYFDKFYKFCFELPDDNVIQQVQNFKF